MTLPGLLILLFVITAYATRDFAFPNFWILAPEFCPLIPPPTRSTIPDPAPALNWVGNALRRFRDIARAFNPFICHYRVRDPRLSLLLTSGFWLLTSVPSFPRASLRVRSSAFTRFRLPFALISPKPSVFPMLSTSPDHPIENLAIGHSLEPGHCVIGHSFHPGTSTLDVLCRKLF